VRSASSSDCFSVWVSTRGTRWIGNWPDATATISFLDYRKAWPLPWIQGLLTASKDEAWHVFRRNCVFYSLYALHVMFSCQPTKLLVKGKGFLLQGWNGSWDSRRLRLLYLLNFRHYEGGKVVTLTHRPPSPPGISLYSFLEADSTPGYMVPSEPRKKIPSETIGDRSRNPPTSSAVP
jgi:hypothetical protein